MGGLYRRITRRDRLQDRLQPTLDFWIIFYRLVAEDLLLPDLDFDGQGLSRAGLRLLCLVRVSELELSRTHHLNVLDLDPHH